MTYGEQIYLLVSKVASWKAQQALRDAAIDLEKLKTEADLWVWHNPKE